MRPLQTVATFGRDGVRFPALTGALVPAAMRGER